MPTGPALPRLLALSFACAAALATLPVRAQEMVGKQITGGEIRRALIWTGVLSVTTTGDPAEIVKQAIQDWQKSRKYPVTDQLTDAETSELLAEGDKVRESFGWATLEDKSVDFSVGVPTKLVKFVSAHPRDFATSYDFDGGIKFVLGTRYGDLNCASMKSLIPTLMATGTEVSRQITAGSYASLSRSNGVLTYARVLCNAAGIVFSGISIPESLAPQQAVLFSAMADSLKIGRHFNPTGIPRPHIDVPTPTAGDLITVSATRGAPSAKLPDTVDKGGKTAAIRRETRRGNELSVEQVFDKVSPAVYMVKAGDRMGSAVAISEHELLTNCHVVKEVAHVTLVRKKVEQQADVVSVNEKADRCILKSSAPLDTWVPVRPYDDIRTGERAITVGTPQGLELTVADGIVSSKRPHDGSRLVQTTAPISQGSSGGGLFDAEGNLLGITTFYLKVGQNLNFAVAAEDFAQGNSNGDGNGSVAMLDPTAP